MIRVTSAWRGGELVARSAWSGVWSAKSESGVRGRSLERVVWSLECIVGISSAAESGARGESVSGVRRRNLECVVGVWSAWSGVWSA